MIRDKFYEMLRVMLAKYDNKNRTHELFMCDRFNVRNRNKRDEYKIPEDKPQCPVFNDNRCCGSCPLGKKCNHCVDCNCYGFTYTVIGGVESEMTHKASKFYGKSRLDENGKFDWDYYWENSK